MAEDVPGTATEELPNDPAVDETPPDTTETPADGATESTPAEPAKAESFIDPSTLPPELKSHWSSMHRAYTKKLEALNGRKGDLDFLDQYRSNPDVARQVLQQEAARLGYTLATGTQPANGHTNGSPAAATSAPAEGVPPDVLKAAQEMLPPELQWMAPYQAALAWRTARMATAPLVQESQQTKQAAYLEKVREARSAVDGIAPGWLEDNKADFSELLAYLSDDNRLDHPKFGNKFTLLHGVLTGGARARVQAAESMAAAVRNKSTTGQSGRSVTPNIADQVRNAPNNTAAIDIAAKAAIESLKAQGVPVPA